MPGKRFKLICDPVEQDDLLAELATRSMEHGVRILPTSRGSVVEVVLQGDEENVRRFYESVRGNEELEITPLREQTPVVGREAGFTILSDGPLVTVVPANDMRSVEDDIHDVRRQLQQLRRTDFLQDPLQR